MNKLLFSFIFFTFTLQSAPLRVGMELSYPPFEMVSPDGTPSGISVDIAHALGEFLDTPVEIENIPFVGLVPSLKNGAIDLIISSLTITKEREKAIDFSEPYATSGLSLLININSKLTDINQANNKETIIVVKSGTSGEVYAKRHLELANIRILDKEAMCVLEVVQGKADAFIYDQLSVYVNWKKNPTTTKVNLKAFQEEHWGIGMRKNNDELLNKVNQFIKTFREKGGFDRLAKEYMPDEVQAFKAMGVPFVF